VKQPKHATRKLYHLAIYGADNYLIHSFSRNSLRESLRLARLYVDKMDSYQRLTRELIRVPGAYASTFHLLPPSGASEGEIQPTCLVLLRVAGQESADDVFPPILGGKPG
jgi:hypothetical protein